MHNIKIILEDHISMMASSKPKDIRTMMYLDYRKEIFSFSFKSYYASECVKDNVWEHWSEEESEDK